MNPNALHKFHMFWTLDQAERFWDAVHHYANYSEQRTSIVESSREDEVWVREKNLSLFHLLVRAVGITQIDIENELSTLSLSIEKSLTDTSKLENSKNLIENLKDVENTLEILENQPREDSRTTHALHTSMLRLLHQTVESLASKLIALEKIKANYLISAVCYGNGDIELTWEPISSSNVSGKIFYKITDQRLAKLITETIPPWSYWSAKINVQKEA